MPYRIRGNVEVEKQLSAEIAIVSGRVVVGGSSVPTNSDANAGVVFPARGTEGTQRVYMELQGVYNNDSNNIESGPSIRFRTSTNSAVGGEIIAVRASSGDGELLLNSHNGTTSNTVMHMVSDRVGIRTYPAEGTTFHILANTIRFDVGLSVIFLGTATGPSGQVLRSSGNFGTTAWNDTGSVTTADVLSATAGVTAGIVGTYAMLSRNGNPTTSIALGATVAGSNLRPVCFMSNIDYSGQNQGSRNAAGEFTTARTGTWRCMSFSRLTSNLSDITHSIAFWLRIS